jgi:hypothetical protein
MLTRAGQTARDNLLIFKGEKMDLTPLLAFIDVDISTLVHEFGPLVGVILFFIWRDWKREDILTTRVTKLEDDIRTILEGTVKRATEVMSQNTECLTWIARIFEKMCDKCPHLMNFTVPKGLNDVERN